MMPEVWWIVGGVSFALVAGIFFLVWRMPVYRWYCRRCKKIVSAGRFHPKKCTCDTTALVANYCRTCRSWNTSSAPHWHCNACSSKAVILGAEYNLRSGLWRFHNQS